MKLLEASELFNDEEFRLSRFTLLRIEIEVKIICAYLKLKRKIFKR